MVGCRRCGRRAATAEALRGATCSGRAVAVEAAHAPHRLGMAGAMALCLSCGGHGMVVIDKLRKPCVGKCSSPWASDRLRRLLKGRHPTTGEELGPVVPML